MAGTASAKGVASGGFEPALEARLASEQRSFRREALLLGALLSGACVVWIGLRDGASALWPLRLELGGALLLSLAPALAAALLGRRLPSRARRIARLDEELEARGALVAAAELPADGTPPLGSLLRRGFARRMAAPLPASAQRARRERRRARLSRWALLALFLWLWLWLARLFLGPDGPAPRGVEGELAGTRSATSGAGPASAVESQRADGGPGAEPPREESASSEEPDPRAEPEPPRDGPPEPLPPEPERRLEDFFVRLQEQAGGSSSRDLWVVPLAPAEGGEQPSAAGAGGRSEPGASAPRPRLAGADLEELKRAAERASLPATFGERERAWVERYYAALRKLP